MVEKELDVKEILKLKQMEVIYTDSENKMQEVRVETSFVSEDNITAKFEYLKDFNITCPQRVTVKFAINNIFCTALAILDSFKRVGKDVFLTILTPNEILEQQQRKYYRVNLQRTCVLIATDKKGCNNVYMSRLVDLSVGGLLMHQLESMYDSSYVLINPYDYEKFNIVLFLDVDAVLKLSAKYIRQEQEGNSYRYAFEFLKTKGSEKDLIHKYVTKEQVEQLKLQSQKA